jgi:transcriptional regulator with GAF, ATPase, and Fis domain
MLEVPSRETLGVVNQAADAVLPTPILGFARSLGDARVSILYSCVYGIGEYVIDASDIPDALKSSSDGPREADLATLKANPLRAIEWQLAFVGAQHLLSLPIGDSTSAHRFWVGLADVGPLTPDRIRAFEGIAARASTALNKALTAEEAAERSRRYELAAELFAPVLRVLDVREVFDRLSTLSKKALGHDMLTLGLLSDDMKQLTLYAQTGATPEIARVFPQPYPSSVIQAWGFDIVDDRTIHPLEKDRPPTRAGMRSTVRVPIRFDDRLIGGLAFSAIEPAQYTSVDVAVAHRLANYVAVALSHHRLAEQLAEQARHNEELRARTTNLEMLDALLVALIDSGDLADVFDRVCAIARKVLAHDAAALMIRLGDTHQARVYARTGFPTMVQEIYDIPEEVLRNPDWEYDIFDDLTPLTDPRYVRLVTMGFRSLMRVPIRLERRFAGALIFLSKSLAAFKPADILVARRMADRMAVTLARDREAQASKRADEASERASKLEVRVKALTEELDSRTGYRRVVGDSASWRQVLKQATQVAATETTVLLLGESGTGKEVVARFVHRASSRTTGPFSALNCAALPEQLLEAELFGYERGAYTGATQSKPGELEQAAGGTLFLDEVAEMSLSAQAKFLRVLQEHEFKRLGGTRTLRTDARIIAATNRDLHRAIDQRTFREDLYYRLNVFAIRLPPLRERPEDILPLSEAFLADLARGFGRPPAGISRDARKLLTEYHWPGNVRELRNMLERAAILCEGGLITTEYLSFPAVSAPAQSPPFPAAVSPPVQRIPVHADTAVAAPSSAGDLQSMERNMIQHALEGARFNKSRAAKSLGLTRQQLYVRMRKYGLA